MSARHPPRAYRDPDVVVRLRTYKVPIALEAADEIERLRTENDEMKFIIDASTWTAEQVNEWLREAVVTPKELP